MIKSSLLGRLGQYVPLSLLRRFLLAESNRSRLMPVINELYFTELIRKTRNFGDVTWCNKPIWQNVLDLWTIQEELSALKPSLLIECGTNQGGSAGRVIAVENDSDRSFLACDRSGYLVDDSIGNGATDKK